MNDCIEFHFQDLSIALEIATTCSTSSVYLSYCIQNVTGHCVDETNNNGSKIDYYASGMYYIVTLCFIL